MNISKIITNFSNKINICKYEKAQRQIDKYTYVTPLWHSPQALQDTMAELHTARGVLANYAKHEDIFVKIVPEKDRNNDILNVSVGLLERNGIKTYLVKSSNLNLGLSEDTPLRQIYKTVSDLTKQIKNSEK